MDDSRPFPILSEHDGEHKGCVIPWWLAEIAYKEYANQFGNGQTLERIAERGGFGRKELVSLLAGQKLGVVNA